MKRICEPLTVKEAVCLLYLISFRIMFNTVKGEETSDLLKISSI